MGCDGDWDSAAELPWLLVPLGHRDMGVRLPLGGAQADEVWEPPSESPFSLRRPALPGRSQLQLQRE